jgi:hypothetical protein
VKDEELAEGAVRHLIAEFRERNAKFIAEGRLHRYVIACPHLSSRVHGFAKKLAIHRRHHFGPHDDDERQASLEDLATRAAKLKLQEHFDFIVGHVLFEQDLAGLQDPCDGIGEVLSVRLMRLLALGHLEEGEAVAAALLRALADDRARAWDRDQLGALLAAAVRTYRAGPPRPAGDLILVRHETLKRVDIAPGPEDEADLFRDRRVVSLPLDAVESMASLDAYAMAAVAAELARAEGPYRKALATPGARAYSTTAFRMCRSLRSAATSRRHTAWWRWPSTISRPDGSRGGLMCRSLRRPSESNRVRRVMRHGFA